MDIITIIQEFGQWGIAGLFFIMWFFERKDRLRAVEQSSKIDIIASSALASTQILIDIVKSNTSAMEALRAELAKLAQLIDKKLDAK